MASGRRRSKGFRWTDELRDRVRSSKVLMVGAGGIGCELLKTLVLSGFRDVEIIDMDTIETSNLNRQFLFRKHHVGHSKAQVAKEAVSKFCPDAKIVAHHGNVKDSTFDVDFFRKFDVVMNGLDNLEARRHVNRLCLAADVPLVESGTTGYLGQVTVHIKGLTECFECQPKPAPKTYPVCTIRNTPDKPIHCIVWAKDLLFNRLFGKQDEVTDLDEQREQDDEAAGDHATEQNFFQRTEEEEILAYAERVFERVFKTDIEKVSDMEELWKTRTPPKALCLSELMKEHRLTLTSPLAQKSFSAAKHLGINNDHGVWTPAECASIFLCCVRLFFETRPQDLGHAVFDKDDRLAVEFVTAAANLRSYNYNIPPQSLFDAKGMAGNIVHAVATTNAIVAGLIVVEGIKILEKQPSKALMTYVLQFPSNGKLLQPVEPAPPNERCYVCRRSQLVLSIDTSCATLGRVVADVIKKRMSVNSPSIILGDNILYEEGDSLEPDETEIYMRNSKKSLRDLPGGGITHNSIIAVSDYEQHFECELVVCHVDAVDEEEHPDGFILEGKIPDAKAEEANGEGKRKMEEEDDDVVIATGPLDLERPSKKPRIDEDVANAEEPRVEIVL